MADEYISVMDSRWRKPDEQKARNAGLIRGLLDISPLAALDAPKQAMQYIPSARLVGGLLGLGKVEAPTDALATALRASRPSGIYSETAGAAYDAGRAVPQAAAAVGGLLGMNAPKVEHGKLNIFAGVNAKTADKAALAKAEEMTKAGADPRKVWADTGWFKGVDGKWRFEIDDSAVPIKTYGTFDELNQYPKIDKALPHKDALKAYPDMRGTLIGPERDATTKGSYGDGLIKVQPRPAGDTTPEVGMRQKSTILHEMQHGIQDREGFATGGSPAQFWNGGRINPETGAQYSINDALDAYRRLAGEAEARAVQSRMGLNAAQRRALFPLDSYDVPVDQLIIR